MRDTQQDPRKPQLVRRPIQALSSRRGEVKEANRVGPDESVQREVPRV